LIKSFSNYISYVTRENALFIPTLKSRRWYVFLQKSFCTFSSASSIKI